MRSRLLWHGGYNEDEPKAEDPPKEPPKGPTAEAHAEALAKAEAAQTELRALQEQTATLAAEIAKNKADREKAATKKREKDGEILGLYEESKGKLTTAQERNAELEAKVKGYQAAETARLDAARERNTARLAELPEDLQEVVKALPDGASPDTVAAQLQQLEGIAGTREGKPPPKGGRSGGGKKTPKEPIPEACKAEADRRGMDHQSYFEGPWRKNQARREREKARRSA